VKLTNGAKVVCSYKPGFGLDGWVGIVAEYRGEYVVWRAVPSETKPGEYDCIWGDYHKTLEEAKEHFLKRFKV
jgi:hypothetical protein